MKITAKKLSVAFNYFMNILGIPNTNSKPG